MKTYSVTNILENNLPTGVKSHRNISTFPCLGIFLKAKISKMRIQLMQTAFLKHYFSEIATRNLLIMQGYEIIKLCSIHTMEKYSFIEIIIKTAACRKAFEISMKGKKQNVNYT